MSYRNLAWLLTVPAMVMLAAALTATAPPPDKDYRLVRSVVDVLAEVDRNYYRALTDEERHRLVEDMINGGLSRLDAHSQYFNEKEYEQFRNHSEGQFGGIGALLVPDPVTRGLKVQYPMYGSPAEASGLEANDIVIKVNDTEIKDLAPDDARSKIKGLPGTRVKLTVLKPDAKQPVEIVITRAIIETHSVEGYRRNANRPSEWDYMIDESSKIAMIRLNTFNVNTSKEMRDAISQIEAAGAKALILDLRGNPGGLLSEAVKVSNMFLPGGKIVATKDRQGHVDAITADPKAMIFGPAEKKPMVVLINTNSASASEIVAAALQDNNRSVIVGERSYGKGSVQQVHLLSDHKTALKLTSKIWLRPNGKKIHKDASDQETDEWGVTPDSGFDIKLSQDDRIQYLLHTQHLSMGKQKPPAPKTDDKEDPDKPRYDPNYQDKVIKKALEHLRAKVKELAAAPVQASPA